MLIVLQFKLEGREANGGSEWSIRKRVKYALFFATSPMREKVSLANH
jgi:hypothetical protein